MRISDWSSVVCSSDLAVFLDLQELRAAQRDRQPADRDVAKPFAAGAFRAHARNVAEDFGHRTRAELLDLFFGQRAGRSGAVEAVAGAGNAGGHEIDALFRGLRGVW